MRKSTKNHQRGVSTLIMILALGAAMAASLYGAYSHIQATGKSQNTSSDRSASHALAQDGVTATAEYLNELYCGTPNTTCTSGNASAVSATAIPNGTVLADQSMAGGTMTAAVLNNTFASNGRIEIVTHGQATGGPRAGVHAYLAASTIYTFTPLQYAFLINGNQNLTGHVQINTGTSSLAVRGNLSVGGDAGINGSVQATGSITGCPSTATCTSGVSSSSIASPKIDTYTLNGEANAVLSVNAQGQAQVTFENDAALAPAGTTLLSQLTGTSLCEGGGASCISPPSANDGRWAITGTPNPGVLYFYGDVSIASGVIGTSGGSTGYATIIATGNVLVATENNITAYGQMPNVCNHTTVPTNVCPNGQTSSNNGEGSGPVANAVVISGGNVDYPYTGSATVYVNGASSTGVPPIGDTTESAASDPVDPSGTATGYYCSSNGNSVGASGTCPSASTTTGVITGGNVTLQGNGDLTGVVAAAESLTAKGTGTITGMIDTADANNLSSSTLGNTSSTNQLKGNLTVQYAPGVSNMTNFGGGGQTPALAFVPVWQRFLD